MLLPHSRTEPFSDISSVAHDGKIVFVGTDTNGSLFYTVKQDGFEDSARADDAAEPTGWEEWKALPLPGRYRDSNGHWAEEKSDPSVLEKEREIYAAPKGSETLLMRSCYKSYAMSAVAPVQLVSGLGHLFVFRQSRDGTLLADRFVLDGMTNLLVRKLEVRFKRSEQKYTPLTSGTSGASQTLKTIDSLDFRNTLGAPFFEATREFCFVKHLTDGQFSVILVPTADHHVSVWHFFVWNTETKKVESFAIRSTKDEVFALRDTHVMHPKRRKLDGIVKHSFAFTCDDGKRVFYPPPSTVCQPV